MWQIWLSSVISATFVVVLIAVVTFFIRRPKLVRPPMMEDEQQQQSPHGSDTQDDNAEDNEELRRIQVFVFGIRYIRVGGDCLDEYTTNIETNIAGHGECSLFTYSPEHSHKWKVKVTKVRANIIYIITWNVAAKSPNRDLTTLLDLNNNSNQSTFPDFYIVGIQELNSQMQNFVIDSFITDPWTTAFKNALAPYKYVKIKTARLVGMLLNIFCLEKHVHHVRDIYAHYTRTGFLNLWGNKGAVTVRFQIYGCSLVFINCHLAPHDGNLLYRIDDYNNIVADQKFPTGQTTSIFFHDYVFWFGDLNFRLTNAGGLPANEIINRIKKGDIGELFTYDELKQVIQHQQAFNLLEEPMPPFRPTYKFLKNTDQYDSERRPAWTDRILFHANKAAYENMTLQVTPQSYASFEQYSVSDHKPVASKLSIKVFSDYAEKNVTISPVGTWYTGLENKVKIQMEDDVKPSIWDWIGIYQANFAGLDEYLHYIYLPSVTDDAQTTNGSRLTDEGRILTAKKQSSDVCDAFGASCSSRSSATTMKVYYATFEDTTISRPGSYRLLYITQNYESVLAISDPFDVVELLSSSSSCSNSNSVRRTIDW